MMLMAWLSFFAPVSDFSSDEEILLFILLRFEFNHLIRICANKIVIIFSRRLHWQSVVIAFNYVQQRRTGTVP